MKHPYYRIELTKLGYLFIALCLGIGIAALNTGNNLLYLTFGMMLSFIILSGLLSNNTLHGVTLKPFFPKRIFAGASFQIKYDIENRKKRFPSFAINIFPVHEKSQTQVYSEGTFVLKIAPQKTERAASRIEFKTRGYQELPDFRIETAYPFGLLKKYMTQGSAEKTVVYPRLLSLDSKLGLENQYLGEILSGARGESGNPYGIRQFVFGDPYRYIHWKSSAKKGELRIKEFENEKRMSLEIDLRLSYVQSAETEVAVSLAASFAKKLIDRDIDVFLRINGELIHGKLLDEIYTALALCHCPIEPISYKNLSRENQAILISDLERAALTQDALMIIAKEDLVAYV